MADLTNYAQRKLQFKLIDFHTQVAKDRLHSVPKSMLVLQKDNLTEQEFFDYTHCVITELKKRYVVQKPPHKLTKFHELLIVSKKAPAGLPEGV